MPARTPFVILGDLNAIPGRTAFVDALRAGRASAAMAASGATDGLDWDGSLLADARPTHNAAGSDTYTWRDDTNRYPPSALDRVLYSDSVLSVVHQFVLNTMAMPYEDLRRAGLRSIDVMRDARAGVHDHFPIVIDVVPGREP